MLPRILSTQLSKALEDTPAVFLQGARQTGKSTLARQLAGRRYVTLDEATALAAARADPAGFIAGLAGPVTVDEVQRAPALPLAIKAAIDKDRTPGRFLLTGSAAVDVLPRLADSLVGRLEVLTLWPFAQAELARAQGGFVEAAFTSGFPDVAGEVRGATLARLLRGGYPEAVERADPARRARWFESYLVTLLQREVRDLAHIDDVAALPRLLQLIAARSSTVLNQSELSRSSALPYTTLRRYLGLLEATFLLRLVPAFSRNLSKRLVRAPKALVADSGLCCHLAGATDVAALSGPALGPLLETFVAGELLRLCSWSPVRARPYHFRTHQGREVDLVLEDARGRVVGLEVKASATVTSRDFDGLEALAELAGDDFVRGAVLYLGEQRVPFGERLCALPVTALWT